MEGNLSAAPRLACDYYKSYCWASDPPLEGEAQAYNSAEIKLPESAYDPQSVDGQAYSNAELLLQQYFSKAENRLHALINEASDPQSEGQASTQCPIFDQIDGLTGPFAAEINLPTGDSAQRQGRHTLKGASATMQASSCEAEFNLQIGASTHTQQWQAPIKIQASDPIDGQAGQIAAEIHLPNPSLMVASATKQALLATNFDPHGYGTTSQDPPHDGHTDGASDLKDARRHAPPKGTHAVNFNIQTEFLAALCGMPINQVQDSALLQNGITLFAALESIEEQAVLCFFPAASSFTPSPLAAHPKASPLALSSSSLTTSAISIPLSTPAAPAIPALIPIHAATPHRRRSIDVLQTSSSTSIPFTTPASISCSSPLRAQASPWMPNKPPLPSLLVGDIPLLPMSLSPKLSHPLLLPVTARQSLAPHHSAETLGFEQPKCCFHCGHSMDSIGCGSTTTIPFGFSPLRGRNGTNQAQESKAGVHHHDIDPVRHSNRPRCKMKAEAELKGFRIQKSTLDPG